MKSTGAPCDNCAFSDPEAWLADQAIAQKLLACLAPGHTPFYCHKGLQRSGADGNEFTPHLSADGSIDTARMTPCGGFLQWAKRWRHKPAKQQQQVVARLQLMYMRRFLASDHPAAVEFRHIEVTPEHLQQAIEMMADGQTAPARREGGHDKSGTISSNA